MRTTFCELMVKEASRSDFAFLTGDLGFKALETLRDAMGRRFINAGVAEQNLVSVAAGLAREGFRPWAYSISPFIYARPFEQVRNDICLHRLPVVLVGNGGGYAYGVMGATHHAIEDYGVLLALPNLRAYVPAFDEDLTAQVKLLFDAEGPAYLRLGMSELSSETSVPEYAQWRKLVEGDGKTIVVVGPLAGSLLAAIQTLSEAQRPNFWVLTELPVVDFPDDFLKDILRTDSLLVVEEHVVQGGAGRMICHQLLESGRAPRQFAVRGAVGYVSGCYGSQEFHRRESGLDARTLMADLTGGLQ